ncbi:MAG: peptidylprolyl isomerase, partial [Prosthecobacter sp.]|nr:peptidylprolyl isomerase [Prosthecobacter sp.]
MKSKIPNLAVLALLFVGLTGPSQAQEAPKVTEAKTVKVVMETSKGTLELELDPAKAPITVANFVSYAKKAHYDGLIFHRVIPGFMIQGGGFTPDMEQKKVDASIKIESNNGLKNARGTIAMARTSDPNSATSQFFINVKDNNNLDYPSFDGYGYTVFGKVTKGTEVIDAIVAVKGFGRWSAQMFLMFCLHRPDVLPTGDL